VYAGEAVEGESCAGLRVQRLRSSNVADNRKLILLTLLEATVEIEPTYEGFAAALRAGSVSD
jgi:hypothetical protein